MYDRTLPKITSYVLEFENLCFSLAQQPVYQPLWLELDQVRIILPDTQKQHRLACDVGDGNGRSALGVGIRLRQNGNADGHRRVEQSRALHGIVPSYGFVHEDQQVTIGQSPRSLATKAPLAFSLCYWN